MLRIRLLTRLGRVLLDIPVETFSISSGLNQSSEWSTEIPSDTAGIQSLTQGTLLEFYVDGELYFSGSLQSYDSDIVSKQALSLSGRSLIDELYAKSAYPLSAYTGAPLLGVMVELLLFSGWSLGVIGTLDDPDVAVSQDVRSGRNLLSQINQIIELLPYTYWREGQNYTIDIGLFNEFSRIYLRDTDYQNYDSSDLYTQTLTKLSYTVHFPDAALGVQALGGPVRAGGIDRTINLGDALSYDMDYAYDPTYPIIETLNEQTWVLLNGVDYPYPGGIVTAAGTKTDVTANALGDRDSVGVENRSILFTFKPFPGYFEYFNIWIGTKRNNFAANWTAGNFNITWDLWEVDPVSMNTLQGAALHTQIIDFLPEDLSILRIIPDTTILLEADKLYGIVVYLDAQPSSGLASMTIMVEDAAPAANSMLRANIALTGLPSNGKVYSSITRIPIFQIITTPVTEHAANISVEQQEQFAPPKTGSNSTAGEISNAGNALREFAKNYLIINPQVKKEYSASTSGSLNVPLPGDTVWVKGTAYADYFDPHSGFAASDAIEEVDRELRVTQTRMNFKGELIEVDYTLTDSEGIPVSERLLELYKETRKIRRRDGKQYERPWGLVLDTINIALSDVSPNDFFDDGTPAYQVETDIFQGSIVALPASTEWVYLAGKPFGTSPDGVLRIEVITEPEFVASSPIVFRVGFTTRGWEFGDSADLVVKLVWR